MAESAESLVCTPEPRLVSGEAASSDVSRAFAESDASGLLYLAMTSPTPDLALSWARDWARQFIARLCQTRDPATVELPAEATRSAHLAKAPAMRGAEYLSDALLCRLWQDLASTIAREIAKDRGGIESWLKSQNPNWHLVGRVTFHLAENKRNEEFPFAFLATYTDRLSAAGTLQHTPLGRALQAYAAKKDQAALDALLAPVRIAAEGSALIRELLESKRLFQAVAWTPPEAYRFIREIPLLEEAGLIVKVPDWWKNRRPGRPQVSVTLDSAKRASVGTDAMLAFKADVTLNGAKLTEQEWQQIKAAPAAGLVNLRGEWVEVNRERLDEVLKHFTKVQAAHADGLLSFHQGMRWLAGFTPRPGEVAGADLPEETQEWSEAIAGKQLHSLLQQMGEPEELGEMPWLQAKLRPYQRRGAAWLRFMTQLRLGACLADDMGLGKTLQVITMLGLRSTDPDRSPSLLVVPASLIGNWKAEFARFAPHLRVFIAHPSVSSREALNELEKTPIKTMRQYDALLTTYGLLQRSETLATQDWDVVVIDEAQAIKNPTTAQARAVKQLRARARVALTGTPIENQLGDLWSIFDFLNPGLLGNSGDFGQFTKGLASSKSTRGYAPLRRLISPYILRRLKTDRSVISDLPDKVEMQAHCALTKKQAVLYGRTVEQLKADIANPDLEPNERRGLILGYLIKFKQICNHPSHWSGDGRYAPEDSGKFQRLTEIVTELAARQERCLVFTQFREVTEPLAAHLATVFGRPGLILHGGTPVGKRPELVEEFQKPNGPPFFVLSVKAGGTGLTLTAANHVIHFDRWWNPAVENQATDRAFRIGQKKNVLVHKFVCPGTIEERVDRLIAGKRALADDLLSGDDGAGKLLSEMGNEELLQMVSLDLRAASL